MVSKSSNFPTLLGDFVGEFAKGFRHVSAIAASSSLAAIFGIVANITFHDSIALVFSSLFFSIAALPLAALVLKQAFHIMKVSDPHEAAPLASAVTRKRSKAISEKESAAKQRSTKVKKTETERESRKTLSPPSERPLNVSLPGLGELAEKNPGEATAIIRSWLAKDQT
jgi:flagellar biosynthesis/type III secretory pathway M-ring protein FliF/YscJ